MIDIKDTQEWYAKERNIKICEFDDYDAHVCRVANAYVNVVKKSNIPVVSDTLISWEQFKKANWYESESIDVEKLLIHQFQEIYGR